MKFQVTLKDTDVLYDAITEALEEGLKGFDDDEREVLLDIRREKLNDTCSQWFKWGEYITVEVDTEKDTCRVVPLKEWDEEQY